MPIFVSDEQKFLEIAKRARECRIKKIEKKGIVKIKARTKRYLYTFIIPLEKLEEFSKKLQCSKIVEV
ncbi:MAG TPA: 5'-nucleotidase [Ignisphaera aggregans]|uniref:5'-nucleotidase n=1 Tax=Ignisphaera aggregans TaxID=334771 RepID=A0A832Z1T7_9CREN|nr:5'-nucleotidase [Ignisphaera aggregans]